MNIERICSRNIVYAARSCRLQEAADLMRRHQVGALLVTDDQPDDHRAIGIVTDRDLVRQAMAEGIGPRDATVGEVMTRGLVTIANTADTREAIEAMRENGVRRLAVTGADSGLVGIVSLDDIIDALAAELTGVAGVLRTERERESVLESAAKALRY